MFKKGMELDITIDKYDITTWKILEELIKSGWEIKKLENYIAPITHVIITK